jgi:hypothetical protein
MNSLPGHGVKGDIMKNPIVVSLATALVLVTAVNAEQVTPRPAPPVTTDPPPLYNGNDLDRAAAAPAQVVAAATPVLYVYDQKPLADQPALIPPQLAQAVVDRFRTNYPNLNSPRILIYVNRELVDGQSGLKLSGRSETVETTTQGNSAASGTNAVGNPESTKRIVKNNYRTQAAISPTLADRQTVRDVERLFGRPLRLAGATIVDQTVGTRLVGEQPLKELAGGVEGEQATKDCAAISKFADVVFEILISSRNVTVAEVSGEKNYTVPDIQATAIRLKDAKIIGQASASEVMGRSGSVGYAARTFGVQDVSEATALALMEDILQGAQ